MKLTPFLFAALTLLGCSRHDPARMEAAPPRVPVQVGRVEKADAVRTQAVTGTVLPEARAVVAAKIMGTVSRADVRVGERVVAGQVLVRLSAAEMAARLAQAEAALAQVERDHERESALLARGASTAETVRSLEERRRMADAAAAEARTMLDYTDVRAPFSGVVTRRLVNPGDFAGPGTPLFALEGEDRLRAEVQVPESLPTAALGSHIAVESGSLMAQGTLIEYSPAADPASRTRLAKIELPAEASFRSGQFVRAFWPAGSETVLRVPHRAVTLFGQMERVYTVREGKAHLRLVKTGRREDDRVQILSGLDAGETLVLSPPDSLRDGAPLEVQP